MTRLALALLALLALTACGPEPLDARLFGQWHGYVLVKDAEPSDFAYPADFDIQPSGEVAILSGLCQGGGSSMQVHGEGLGAAWRGHMVCPQVPQLGCEFTTLTVTELQVALQAQPAVELRGQGYIRGCGSTWVVSLYGFGTPAGAAPSLGAP